jgi:hypothetical protein
MCGSRSSRASLLLLINNLPTLMGTVEASGMQIRACPQGKQKTLGVILPRDDAEGLIWKPESRCKIVASHVTLCTRLDTSTSPRGQALNPIQVGFHLIKRKRRAIPFTTTRKNVARPPSLARLGRAALRSQQVLGDEQHVGGAFCEPPHEVGIPLGAEGDVDAHAPALFHQVLLQVAPDSV